MKLTLTLPWPERKLSPNARGNWATKESPRKTAIESGFYAAMQTGVRLSRRGRYALLIEAHPPEKTHSDWDNLVGRLKYYQDGFCRGLGINDSRIKTATVMMRDPKADGCVIVTIEEET